MTILEIFWMRFNILFDFHKKPNWKDFYFDYTELKDYIINARDFFMKRVNSECEKHPDRIVYQRIQLEENKQNEQGNIDGNIIIDNHNNVQRSPSLISIRDYDKKFATKEQFSKDYIEKFQAKLERVKFFFLEVKNDLVTDYEHLKHLVLSCEDIEVFHYLY